MPGPPPKPTPLKHCLHCHAKMDRHRYNGRLEDLKMFHRRQYCDMQCGALGRMKEFPTRCALLKRIAPLRKDYCEHCGVGEKLSTHHVDKNWRNSDPLNLMTLCSSCHTSHHHRQGDISPAKPKPPCTACGRPSAKRGLCNTHLTRFRKYGSPYLTKKRIGQSWQLVTVDGGQSGRESRG